MSLLPRSHNQFRQRAYWDTFFRRRGRRAFEWYGEYSELCGVLHKYSRPGERMLVVGCGNSTLSADLHDVGYGHVVSIDVSEVVVRQMREQHARDRPGLRFEVMDAGKMEPFEDASFACVVDKGTLDAIFTDGEDQEVVDGVNRVLGVRRTTVSELKHALIYALFSFFYKEIDRVLRVGGRYICISLLQPHILDHLVRWFGERGWPLRVIRCKEAEANRKAEDCIFPVFAVVGTKFKKMENMPQARTHMLHDILALSTRFFISSDIRDDHVEREPDHSAGERLRPDRLGAGDATVFRRPRRHFQGGQGQAFWQRGRQAGGGGAGAQVQGT